MNTVDSDYRRTQITELHWRFILACVKFKYRTNELELSSAEL